MNKPKHYILLKFTDPTNAKHYRVRSVPIIAHTTVCGVEGFAVHRAYYRVDSEPAGQYRVSHIATGVKIGEGAETVEEAIKEANMLAASRGGAAAVQAAITRQLEHFKTMTKVH